MPIRWRQIEFLAHFSFRDKRFTKHQRGQHKNKNHCMLQITNRLQNQLCEPNGPHLIEVYLPEIHSIISNIIIPHFYIFIFKEFENVIFYRRPILNLYLVSILRHSGFKNISHSLARPVSKQMATTNLVT